MAWRHARVKKGGKHQSFKWCVYKENSNTPAFHSRDWREAMAVAVSCTHNNRPERIQLYGKRNNENKNSY